MTDNVPSKESLSKVLDLPLYNGEGKKVKFGDVTTGSDKTIVVFIRHFFCGSCQAYVSTLANVKQEALDNAHAKIVVIGCGEYGPIKFYAETSGFKGSLYTNPDRKLFKHLGLPEALTRTPADQPRRKYLKGRSAIGIALTSIWQGMMKHPLYIGKQGNVTQLGGDFIFNAAGECVFAHRMAHTEDHLDVAELMEKAGVEYVEA